MIASATMMARTAPSSVCFASISWESLPWLGNLIARATTKRPPTSLSKGRSRNCSTPSVKKISSPRRRARRASCRSAAALPAGPTGEGDQASASSPGSRTSIETDLEDFHVNARPSSHPLPSGSRPAAQSDPVVVARSSSRRGTASQERPDRDDDAGKRNRSAWLLADSD